MSIICRLVLALLATWLVVVTTACGGTHLISTLPQRAVDPPFKDPTSATDLHDVVLVGNNWDGTATIFDPHTRTPITTIDIVPDLEKRLAVINQDRERAKIVSLNRRVAGEGHDQLVDDLFTSPDGRYLFASRPSLGDVIAIELATRDVKWQVDIEGFRADHAAISKDGRTLLVSATRARKVHAIDTVSGQIVGGFPSGDEPHENHFSDDNERIYHASIGRVFLPVRSRLLPGLKGDRWFQIVDANSIKGKCIRARGDASYTPGDCEVTKCASAAGIKTPKCIDMREKLEEFGRRGAESAVQADGCHWRRAICLPPDLVSAWLRRVPTCSTTGSRGSPSCPRRVRSGICQRRSIS